MKFRLRDPDLILGGGLYQSSLVFKMKDKYPIVINWVYTHLLIGFQCFSNNRFWYNNHGSWNLKKSKSFPKFHKNHLFFDDFEIVTRTNGFSILIFFQNTEIIKNRKYSNIWNWHFLKNSKSCPILIHIMFISNYLKNGHGVLPWYNRGFTQFLRHGHNKLMIAQTQCSQGYQKLVKKYWLKKISSRSCQVWTRVNCRLELQTLDGNCVFGQSFMCAYFLFMNVCHSFTLKGEKIHTLKPCSWEKNLD